MIFPNNISRMVKVVNNSDAPYLEERTGVIVDAEKLDDESMYLVAVEGFYDEWMMESEFTFI